MVLLEEEEDPFHYHAGIGDNCRFHYPRQGIGVIKYNKRIRSSRQIRREVSGQGEAEAKTTVMIEVRNERENIHIISLLQQNMLPPFLYRVKGT